MADVQENDVKQIIEEIRENIRKGGLEHSPPGTTVPPLDGQVAADLASLHAGYDVYHIHFTSHRQVFGSFVLLAKKILRQLLTPILTRQVAYNAANSRVATHLKEQLEALSQQQDQLRQALVSQGQALQAMQQVQVLEEAVASLGQAVASQGQALQAMQERQAQLQQALVSQEQALQAMQEQQAQLREEALTSQGQALQGMRERVSRAERKLRRILYMLSDGQEVEKEVRIESKKMPRQALEPDFDYFGFEERFRGSEEEIRERQRVYVEYFKGREDVLDIGSGRGEFLELLREAGIEAKGVDVDLDMVLYCREKGLDVAMEDAFAYLQRLPDESLGGIFAAQVIEHLEQSRVMHLVKLCHDKLKTGGVLILETVNPACLTVFARSFFLDLSHVWPFHPESMKFLFETSGFTDISLSFSAPVDPSLKLPHIRATDLLGNDTALFNRAVDFINELIFGYQDYAIVGRKAFGAAKAK